MANPQPQPTPLTKVGLAKSGSRSESATGIGRGMRISGSGSAADSTDVNSLTVSCPRYRRGLVTPRWRRLHPDVIANQVS